MDRMVQDQEWVRFIEFNANQEDLQQKTECNSVATSSYCNIAKSVVIAPFTMGRSTRKLLLVRGRILLFLGVFASHDSLLMWSFMLIACPVVIQEIAF